MSDILSLFMEFMNRGDIYSYSIVLIYGLFIGSFLNVVVYRLPIMMDKEYIGMVKELTNLPNETITSKMSEEMKNEYDKIEEMGKINLSFPSSRCGSCYKKIPIWHNIPILSYLFLRGKCHSCKESYSPRYLFIEALIGAFWCLSFYMLGATLDFLIITGTATALIASSAIDLKHRILPPQITIMSLFAGLYYNTTSSNAFATPQDAVLGVILGYILVYGLIKGYEKLRNLDTAMGEGDLKLYAMCGAWIGIDNLPFLFMASALIGIFQFLCLLPFKKNLANYELPFGPAIILSLFVFIYFNENVMYFINQYMNNI